MTDTLTRRTALATALVALSDLFAGGEQDGQRVFNAVVDQRCAGPTVIDRTLLLPDRFTLAGMRIDGAGVCLEQK